MLPVTMFPPGGESQSKGERMKLTQRETEWQRESHEGVEVLSSNYS